MTRRPAFPLLFLLAAGCGGKPAPTAAPSTGAREAARAFYEAVVRRDWAAAYPLLHPDGTKAVSAAEFARRAEAYRKRLGFEPTGVRVHTCEENGDGATARVELTGHGAGRHHFKDAVVLRRHAGGWRLLLPPRFGAN